MKKIIGFSIFVLLVLSTVSFFVISNTSDSIEQAINTKKAKRKVKLIGMGIGSDTDPQNLRNWFSSRLVNPSGLIPQNIRANELDFAKQIPHNNTLIEDWTARGPYNVGGRTRAIAIDINDENTIVAGGVSGGLWKTEDLGQNWTKLTSNEMLYCTRYENLKSRKI